MKYLMIITTAFALAASSELKAQARENDETAAKTPSSTATGGTAKAAPVSTAPVVEIQHIRPMDQRGLNIFETPKDDDVAYTGFKLQWGAAFSQEFQGLDHKNTADPKLVSGVDANKLIQLGHGFNNATANMYMNAQIAQGIRVALTTYLSARHHQESWVKDGYLLIDASPLDYKPLNTLMKYVTVRAGQFELNYGDAHFRRTDNGSGMFNPLIGNYIMDAFTTEIGGEVYFRAKGFLAMGGMTGGEIHGQVTKPADRAPSYLGKVGYDKRINEHTRVRLTTSLYTTRRTISNTLYSGDRGGSPYYDVVENTTSTETAQAWSGAIQPGLKSKVQAVVVNPFVKFHGLELFGNIEQVSGRTTAETDNRTWKQYVGEAVYRFAGDKLYGAARYNTVKGTLAGMAPEVGAKRAQLGGGWFMTTNVLLKGEYVKQTYNDFPTTDIRNGAEFKGFMVTGVVSF